MFGQLMEVTAGFSPKLEKGKMSHEGIWGEETRFISYSLAPAIISSLS